MTYTTLLLDFDHTLFDSDSSEAAAFVDTLRQFGVADPVPHLDTYRRINRALWSAVEECRLDPSAVRTTRFERLTATLGLDADPQAMADAFAHGLVVNGDLYPGARALLERLAESATLALVTNALAEVQRGRLERLGIARLFQTVVISTEVGASKPDARIFDVAFARLRNPPRRTAVMVGDSLGSDIRGGANYGIATCWYNPARRKAEGGVRITHEIASLEQLPSLRRAR